MLKSSPPYSWAYIFFDETYCMFSVLKQAIKFDCLFLATFRVFTDFLDFFKQINPHR